MPMAASSKARRKRISLSRNDASSRTRAVISSRAPCQAKGRPAVIAHEHGAVVDPEPLAVPAAQAILHPRRFPRAPRPLVGGSHRGAVVGVDPLQQLGEARGEIVLAQPGDLLEQRADVVESAGGPRLLAVERDRELLDEGHQPRLVLAHRRFGRLLRRDVLDLGQRADEFAGIVAQGGDGDAAPTHDPVLAHEPLLALVRRDLARRQPRPRAPSPRCSAGSTMASTASGRASSRSWPSMRPKAWLMAITWPSAPTTAMPIATCCRAVTNPANTAPDAPAAPPPLLVVRA